MNDVMPLHMMESGQFGEVAQLVGLPEQVQRLEELGLRAGARLEMIQSGSPCIIRLNGHTLSFRATEAIGILVR